MPILHMSEAEVARDLHSVLERVRQGVEVVIADDRRPVVVFRSPVVTRTLPEIIADLQANWPDAVMDEDFARDVEAAVEESRIPWTPPSWE